jgi:hypothetical protein
MATNPNSYTNPYFAKVRNDGILAPGQQGSAIGAAMNSTFANLRGQGGPAPMAPPQAAPVAQPNVFQAGLPTAASLLPVPQQVAGELVAMEDQGRSSMFQNALTQAGYNLNPNGQAPAEYQGAVAGARKLYDSYFGAAGGTAGAGAQAGIHAYAPTGLRERVLGAGGNLVFGQGNVMAGLDGKNAAGGNRFFLGQVQPMSANGAAPAPPPNPIEPEMAVATQPQSAAPQGSAFTQNAKAYKDAMTGGGEPITAPGGERFIRDRNGRLQAAGTDPAISARAKQLEASAAEEGKRSVDSSYKLLDEVSEGASTGRNISASIKRVRDLYSEGASSGFGQGAITSIGSAIGRITGKDTKISTQQELNQALGELALNQTKDYAKGGGSVSNFERELFSEAGVNKTRTPQANLKILEALENVSKRNVALDAERVRLEGMNLPATEIAKEIRKMRTEMTQESDQKYRESAGSEVRYDSSGKAWTKDASGKVVPHNG